MSSNSRKAGILLPVFALYNKYGIGCFSKEAYDFVDFLKESGQKYWQILPLGPTGYGDSPYQSFSTFAGNPYFIDVTALVKDGLLTEEECERYSAADGEYINYEKLFKTRFELLRLAFSRFDMAGEEDFGKFAYENAYWLEDYSLFMALKDSFGGKAWSEWDEGIRNRHPEEISRYRDKLWGEMDFYKFQQFYFDKQWKKLKAYANKNDVEIVGDIPIYVAFDSSDAWAHPELFDLDEKHIPNAVAGCPPDPFAITGQLWGNPLYNWKHHHDTGYDWWITRIANCFRLYDVVRIDHFRGFDEFYAIPYEDETAEFGEWRKGPGIEIFNAIKNRLGDKKIIAEDLGFLTDSVRELVKTTGYPGMKVLMFAFDSDNRSEYLPHMIDKNSVIYTGTHDNETVRGWYRRISKDEPRTVKYFNDYTGCKGEEEAALCAIKLALSSVSDTAIIPMQDYLNLDNDARINEPSTLGFNWNVMLKEGVFTEELSESIKKLTTIYGRD